MTTNNNIQKMSSYKTDNAYKNNNSYSFFQLLKAIISPSVSVNFTLHSLAYAKTREQTFSLMLAQRCLLLL